MISAPIAQLTRILTGWSINPSYSGQAKILSRGSVGVAAEVLKKLAGAALGKLIAAGSFGGPATATLGFAAGKFTEALAQAFREEADEDNDLLFELNTTPSDLPILATLPSLPTTEPSSPGPFLVLNDERETVAVDTWDWVMYRAVPPGTLVLGTPDVKLRMEAEARCRVFVWRE